MQFQVGLGAVQCRTDGADACLTAFSEPPQVDRNFPGVRQREASLSSPPVSVCGSFTSPINTKFLGTWYWTLETPNVYRDRGDRCPISVFQKRENGTYGHYFKYIFAGNSRTYTTKEGNMWHCSASATDGKLMFAMPTQYGYWEARWFILGTDYTNYAASYACWFSPDGTLRAWALGWCREKVCSEGNRNIIKGIFTQHEIDVNGLEDLHQESCPAP